MNFLLVAIGGAAGSVLRYAVGLAFAGATFPFATLLVNVAGCFLIGVALPAWDRPPWLTAELRLLLVVGFLGGFTTFSAFGHESAVLMQMSVGRALLNIAANVLFGFAAVLAGRDLALRLLYP